MAEDSDLSRTEPASPRRLLEARRNGDVPRSGELGAWLALSAALAALSWLAPPLFAGLGRVMQASLQSSAHAFPDQPFAPLVDIARQLLPLLALIVLALLLAPLLLRGWVFAPRALAFDARRLDPLAALRRLFSADGAFAIVRSLLKFALVAAVCRLALVRDFGGLLPGAAASPPLTTALTVVFHGLLAVVGTLALFAFADAAWNGWRYRVRHAMSWQEVLAEARESEGSPAMRARVRQRQQAVGQVGNDPLALAGANAKPAAVEA